MLTSATFWIAFIFTLVFAGFFAMLFPETNKGRVIMMVVWLIISFGIGNLAYINETSRNKRWNGGTHKDCGGTYQLVAASQTHMSHSFYYTCDKCGHAEEFSQIMK